MNERHARRERKWQRRLWATLLQRQAAAQLQGPRPPSGLKKAAMIIAWNVRQHWGVGLIIVAFTVGIWGQCACGDPNVRSFGGEEIDDAGAAADVVTRSEDHEVGATPATGGSGGQATPATGGSGGQAAIGTGGQAGQPGPDAAACVDANASGLAFGPACAGAPLCHAGCLLAGSPIVACVVGSAAGRVCVASCGECAR